ncbi:MAG: VTT domain-containing protein [Candidatus Zambryskibacteria bacterium]|nr:VTT domain-containing protein [Candidatus Zambryskibacteria bacterium]
MEEVLNLLYLINDVVLRPDLASAFIIFIFSFVNELLAVIPYALILSGQLIFLTDSLSWALLAKLLVFVAVPVGIGSTFGTLLLYSLAYFGGKPSVSRFRGYLRFSWEDVERVNSRFKGMWYDELIFLIIRSMPVIPSFPLTIAAGFFRMRFLPYLVLTFVGLTIRMMLTLLIIGIGVGSLSELMLLLYNK